MIYDNWECKRFFLLCEKQHCALCKLCVLCAIFRYLRGVMSKSIAIMRHALTENGWQKPDADRCILPEGEVQTANVAQKMAAAGIVPDAVWASPAMRALQTAEIVARQLCPNVEIETVRQLYYDDEFSVAERIEICPDTINCLLIVGHNPMVSRLVSRLSGNGNFGWFATSEVVWLEFDAKTWADIATSAITGRIKISPIKN